MESKNETMGCKQDILTLLVTLFSTSFLLAFQKKLYHISKLGKIPQKYPQNLC
jgi:hypothetical protein